VTKIGVGGEQEIDAAAGLQPLARLREERRDVAVAGTGMPGAVGDVARFAGEGRRARQDHVEERPRRDRRHQVRADRKNPVAEIVELGVVGGGERGVRIDVDRDHPIRPGARGGERQDAGAGADLRDGFSLEIELVDEAGEILAGQKEARVEDGRADDEPKAGGARLPRRAVGEEEMVGEEMDEAAQEPTRHAVRRARPGKVEPVFVTLVQGPGASFVFLVVPPVGMTAARRKSRSFGRPPSAAAVAKQQSFVGGGQSRARFDEG